MSLDNIQLHPIVLQGLFTDSLIDFDNHQPINQKETNKTIATLGNNKQYILIVVASEEAIYLPDDQLNFLLGVLSACNLSMEDVAICNIKKNKNISYKTFEETLKSEKIFLFGVSPAEISLPLEFPDYQIQRFNNQVYLSAPILSKLQTDKAEKTILWNCLKQIFSI
ncbi:MAG: hypothetical protein ABJB11_20470 [Ferruginibacter sp.]